MSFLRKLFGGGASAAQEEHRSRPEDHAGFTIVATPYREGGQFQLCGVISRRIDGELQERRFVRADRFPDLDTAVEMTLLKARQIIDQQGERVFSER